MPSPIGILSLGLSKAIALTAQPWITGPAILALTYGPPPVKDALIELISRQQFLSTEGITRALKVLFTFGVVVKLNNFLNSWATNKWQIAKNTGWQWDKEIAVITGGCGGIGKEMVLGLARQGVRIVILDVIPLPEELKDFKNVSLISCDITSPAALNDAAETIRQQFGHPSILINNAGIGQFHSVLDTPDAFLRKIFDVNLLSHWMTTKQFLPDMVRKNKGHIVTIASLASFAAMPMMADYAATKAGALAFHEGLSGELKYLHQTPGVMTTIVHPAWTKTPMVEPHRKELERRQGSLMSAEYVATTIVKQILSCRGGQIILPKQVSIVSAIRGWPNWLQECLRGTSERQMAQTLISS